MTTIEAKIADVEAQIAAAQNSNNQKKVDSLGVVLRRLHMEKHQGTQPTPKRPLGPTRKLVDAVQLPSVEFLAVWGLLLANPKFCENCRTASGQQTGTKQQRKDALAAFCTTLGIDLSVHKGESVEEHQARTRPLINLAEAIMHLGELLHRLNEFQQRQTSGMPIDAGHLKKVEDVIVFLLKGKYALIAWDLVSQFPAMLPFFIVMANTIADKDAAEAAVRAQEKQAKADAKAAAFGGGGAAVPSVDQVRSFLNGPAVARGGGAAVGGKKHKPPCQRHVLSVPHGTDVSMVPRPTVTLATVDGLRLFYNEDQEAVAQEAARMLGTTLLVGADRERANYLSHQSYLTAVAKGKKREE